MQEKFGLTKEGFIDIVLSRQDLASYTGTTYETVFRIINELVQEGAIAVSGKSIKITNQQMLNALSRG
jgi:CRP/FNR family transcriptional regulator